MFYPKRFKEKVREAYPNNPALYEQLEKGSLSVGTFLYNNQLPTSVSFDTVLTATSLEELQEQVRHWELGNTLYSEWSDLYYEQVGRSMEVLEERRRRIA